MVFSGGLRSRLSRFYKFAFVSPIRWARPNKCDILIYDASGSSVFEPYLREYKVETLALNGEFVNFRCLLRSMFSYTFWAGKPYEAYTDCFIHAASPALVLTFIDNDEAFYRISSRHPHLKTMFVQNGARSEVGDIFDSLEQSDQYHVDYMLVHGLAIGRHYQKYISGMPIPIGSLRSNSVSRVSCFNSKKTALFISHYLCRPYNGEPLFVTADGKTISWEKFFAAENSILPILRKWCAENCYALHVLGREIETPREEREFYEQYFAEGDWEYFERSPRYSPYQMVDKADIVVFIDSTLGYESIGRGNRTASFSCRGASINSAAAKFGWPMALPDSGPFWTNLPTEQEYRRVMNYLATVDDETWDKVRQRYADELMAYDDANVHFKELISLAALK